MKARRPVFGDDAIVERTALTQRERWKLKKRRQRARLYDAGLGSDGRPVKDLEAAMEARTTWVPRHEDGCGCYDCLFGGGER